MTPTPASSPSEAARCPACGGIVGLVERRGPGAAVRRVPCLCPPPAREPASEGEIDALRATLGRARGLLGEARVWVDDGVKGRFVPRSCAPTTLGRIDAFLAETNEGVGGASNNEGGSDA